MIRYRDTDYFATESGGIWSEKTKKFLKLQKHKRGYLVVSLCGSGKYYTKAVHLIVAECFIPNPNSLPMVNHKDGDKHNPSSDNLEWVTQSGNARHAVDNGLLIVEPVSGADNGMSRPVECLRDGEWIKFNTMTDAGKFVGVGRTSISFCCSGKRITAGGYKWRYTI